MGRSSMFNPILRRNSSPTKALQRMARDYPAEYDTVCRLRNTHEILYKLNPDDFESICKEALRGLVKEGICKGPQF